MLLSVLLRQEQGLNHTKIQEIKGQEHKLNTKELILILKFRKLVQNVDQWVGQNVLMKVQKVVHSPTQNHQEHEEHGSTRDINELSRKVHLHESIKQ